MAQFVITRGDERRVVDLREDRPVVVGRSRDADIHLDDPSLSRRHCEVRKTGPAHWILRDLGSFNGTYCNDQAVTEHRLTHGDRVQLGLSVLTFQLSAEERQKKEDSGVVPTDVGPEMARRMRNFVALLDIAKALGGSVEAQDQLLELVVEKGIGLCNAERGFLIVLEGEEPVFRVARTREWQPIDAPEKQVSNTVLQNVAKSGEPLLTINAQGDLGGMSATIAALEIRSLMCAPLKVKGRVAGCIYVDSSVAEQEFTDEALELLQAFADQAAIAMENARLYEEARKAQEREKQVRTIFQKYVPADVVRRALEIQDVRRMSTKQVATVLFSDIRGFTSMSERMEPEQVVSFLNDYLQRMVEVVQTEGGIVDKFIGDAVMAVFGAPFPKPDDATRAVRAGIRMLEEVDRFNADQAQKSRENGGQGGVAIRIGIGIHTGPLLAGNIGSDRKMEYTVIGDTVNIASRVESLNKELHTEMLITQACFDATRRRVPVRPKPPVMVKGKELPLQVYEALRPEQVAEAEARGELYRPESPLAAATIRRPLPVRPPRS